MQQSSLAPESPLLGGLIIRLVVREGIGRATCPQSEYIWRLFCPGCQPRDLPQDCLRTSRGGGHGRSPSCLSFVLGRGAEAARLGVAACRLQVTPQTPSPRCLDAPGAEPFAAEPPRCEDLAPGIPSQPDPDSQALPRSMAWHSVASRPIAPESREDESRAEDPVQGPRVGSAR
ncbi:hypothetical protein JHW43_003194 [Diplocarpon mali]|nr:hypothetical protein JHW43_003194 [Diplocarpon mali]